MNTQMPPNPSTIPCTLSTALQRYHLTSQCARRCVRWRTRPFASALLRGLQVRISLLDTLGAKKRVTCGGVLSKPERVGWVLPQDGGPYMLVECVRGVEAPEPEAEPAEEATTTITTLESGSGSGECGADSSPTPSEEMSVEVWPLEGPTSRLRRPAGSTNTCCTPLSRSHVLSRRYSSRTRSSFAHPLAPPYPRARPHRSRSRSNKPKKSPPTRERKLTDEWTLSMHWPIGHAWPPTEIEEVLPVGEVVTEAYG